MAITVVKRNGDREPYDANKINLAIEHASAGLDENITWVTQIASELELTLFDDIPHLMSPVVRDVKQMAGVLRQVWKEMDRRYDIFSEAQAMITVTEEAISTNVLKVPTGTFNRPIGQ